LIRFLLLAAVVAASLPARAALDVAWDCFLPSSDVRCTDLERALFSDPAYARAAHAIAESDPADAGAADVDIRVRSMPSSDGAVYEISVAARDGNAFTFKDRVPRGFSRDAVLLRLVGDVQKATVPPLVLDEPGQPTTASSTSSCATPTRGRARAAATTRPPAGTSVPSCRSPASASASSTCRRAATSR
jgi:hypothetical protein